jgi:hypothetical protein
MESESKILINKDGMKFEKYLNNSFKLSFTIENNNINLAQIINLDLIKLIYDLNPDIYKTVNLQKKDDNEATITLVMKHFFIDVGLPQRYSYVNIKKTIVNNEHINFTAKTITDFKPENIPDEIELVPMENMSIDCKLIGPHKVNFNCVILFKKNIKIPPFVEKIIGVLVNKIFNRVKLFIEKIIIN